MGIVGADATFLPKDQKFRPPLTGHLPPGLDCVERIRPQAAFVCSLRGFAAAATSPTSNVDGPVFDRVESVPCRISDRASGRSVRQTVQRSGSMAGL